MNGAQPVKLHAEKEEPMSTPEQPRPISQSWIRQQLMYEALQNCVDSAVTDSDTCAICGADITKHSEGCAIEIATSILKRFDVPIAVNEFISDWHKREFELPELAEIDVKAIMEAAAPSPVPTRLYSGYAPAEPSAALSEGAPSLLERKGLAIERREGVEEARPENLMSLPTELLDAARLFNNAEPMATSAEWRLAKFAADRTRVLQDELATMEAAADCFRRARDFEVAARKTAEAALAQANEKLRELEHVADANVTLNGSLAAAQATIAAIHAALDKTRGKLDAMGTMAAAISDINQFVKSADRSALDAALREADLRAREEMFAAVLDSIHSHPDNFSGDIRVMAALDKLQAEAKAQEREKVFGEVNASLEPIVRHIERALSPAASPEDKKDDK